MGVDVRKRRCEVKLGRWEGGEFVIRIDCIREETVFKIKKKLNYRKKTRHKIK